MKPRRPRILYVDDDAALCRLVQRDLARHGYDVVIAASATEGERLVATDEEGFDAICLDHFMPDQDGLATMSRLKARPGMPPVVFVTGSDEGRLAIQALRDGAADYVIKEARPEFLGLLRSAIEGAIEREALRRQAELAHQAALEARDRAEELARERQILLQEVNHRVANSLQLIAALTTLQQGAVTDPEARHALAEVRNRVMAVAQVHRRLYTSADVRRVSLHDYLGGLIEEIGRSVEGGRHRFRFELDLAPVTVPTDTAVKVGVVVAELVTNAIKYAYPKDQGGPIRVALAQQAETGVLAVEDDGVGIPGSAAACADQVQQGGVGQRIMQAMASALKGQVEVQPKRPGTRIQLIFPLDEPGT